MSEGAVPWAYAITRASADELKLVIDRLAEARQYYDHDAGREDLDLAVGMLREVAGLLADAAEAYWKAMEAELPPDVDL